MTQNQQSSPVELTWQDFEGNRMQFKTLEEMELFFRWRSGKLEEQFEARVEVEVELRKAAYARIEALVSAVEQVEWVNHGDHRSCPGCGNWEQHGHHPDCPVRLALEGSNPASRSTERSGNWALVVPEDSDPATEQDASWEDDVAISLEVQKRDEADDGTRISIEQLEAEVSNQESKGE